MNVVKEINKINQLELDLGVSGASWHDEYKDSAYIFVGGIPFDLTEGDVITIFSQYGEVMDLNLPRDKETGKRRGFGFLMYEDQRSTVLAVDNLNGAVVLEKTLRVDHVKDYKQPKHKDENGEWVEPDEQSLNAKPEMLVDGDAGSDSDVSSALSAGIDPEDPMREYLLAQRREAKERKKAKKAKRKDETPEERRARKARKAEKKGRKAEGKDGGKREKEKGKGKEIGSAARGVEALLSTLGARPSRRDSRSRSRSPLRRSTSPRVRRPRSPDARGHDGRAGGGGRRSPDVYPRARSPGGRDDRGYNGRGDDRDRGRY
ncbi:hypothetical protein B0H15DRAFT_945156 [Mycena belliarum]|uniref:RRM domain-containing protein n=1 Tax=Mycena belliarum TaxID=1033014 RepID=A0AAD6XTL3_9AGAR|nr:hypothetical protein B0H15DRAFT_945156 [Mycena belliae]